MVPSSISGYNKALALSDTLLMSGAVKFFGEPLLKKNKNWAPLFNTGAKIVKFF